MRGAYASLYYHIGGTMTPTDICNQALALINAGLLYSYEEETEQGRQCRMQYDATRQLVLRQFEWNFARKNERLVLSAHKINGWNYVYAYPEQCIRILGVIPQGDRFHAESQPEYNIFNIGNNKKCIVSDVPLAFIDYIYDVTDLDVWDSISLYMLQCKLASALAMPLTGDRGLFDQAYKLYQAAVQEAKGMNAKERKQDVPYISSYVKARDW
jgi:hypothetical protein